MTRFERRQIQRRITKVYRECEHNGLGKSKKDFVHKGSAMVFNARHKNKSRSALKR